MTDAASVRAEHRQRTLTVEQWTQYREDVLAYMERTNDTAWWERTGRALLWMADGHLARLRPKVGSTQEQV